MAPRHKPKSTPALAPDTPKQKRSKKPRLHASLQHLASDAVPVDDTELFPGAGLQDSMLSYLIYRIGPKSVTLGKRVYLGKFWEAPDAESIKAQYGGGEYHIAVHDKGRLVKGSARIMIAGEPITESHASDVTSLGDLPTSSDPVVNILVKQVEKLTERLLTGRRESNAIAPRQDDSAFTPESFERMLNIARKSRYTDLVMQTALGGETASPTISEKVISDRMTAMLEMLKMGMELGQNKEPTESGGLMELIAPLVQKILANNPLQAPAVRPVGVTATGAVGIADVQAGSVPSRAADPANNVEIDQNRERLETDVAERRLEVLAQKLSKAVTVMLSAIESETIYTDVQILGFIYNVILLEELSMISDYLTFDHVRQLMRNEPEDQISLDNNKERVESVLAAIQKQLES